MKVYKSPIQYCLQKIRHEISMKRGTKEAFVLRQILEDLYDAYNQHPKIFSDGVTLDRFTA